MTPPQVGKVLKKLGEHLGIDDMPRFLEDRFLHVGGHDLLLVCDEANEPDVLLARVDVGRAAEHGRAWLWHRLLVSNFEWSRCGLLGWGLTPQDDRVVLTTLFRFNVHTTGVELAEWLQRVVVCAEGFWMALTGPQAVADIQDLTPLMPGVAPLPDLAQKRRWMSLVRAWAGGTAGADGDGYSERVSLTMDGTPMLLQHHAWLPDRFEVRVDLGTGEHLSAEQLWRGLLWNNFLVGAGGHNLLGVHPESRHVVLMLQQDIPADATAGAFAEYLRAIAASARSFWTQVGTGISALNRAQDSHQVRTAPMAMG